MVNYTKQKISEILGNLPQGVGVVLDIDETLIFNAVDKYGELSPTLTEPDLPELLKYLKETGHPIILLTARKDRFQEETIAQLKKLNIYYDDLLYAPNKDGQSTKGAVLAKYLHKNHERFKLNKYYFIDNEPAQLESVEQAFEENDVLQVKCKLYKLPTTLLTDDYRKEGFPESLDTIRLGAALGGGTKSTFKVDDENLVFKFGDSELQLKVEMLMNMLYEQLGVAVPAIQAYSSLPSKLAKSIGLAHTARAIQLSQYIKPADNQDSDAIRKQAALDFIVHAFLGNIDIGKEDNFIQTPDGQVVLIDAGANFIYRALGDHREEDSNLITEIDSMREIHGSWFGNISDDEIKRQVAELMSKRNVIEKTIWEVTQQLQLPASVQNQILASFSNRLDQLALRYGFATQKFAKRDKLAIDGQTAAGILHIQRDENGKPCVLLSKRVKHEWCDNFGGKSDPGDDNLAKTAAREVAEESNGVLNYSERELANSSFHDIVTTTKNGAPYVYRMYVAEGKPINTLQLHDKEHTTHHLVPLESLVESLERNELVTEEGKQTIEVEDSKGKKITIFPPLLDMLKQAPMTYLLKEKLKGNDLLQRTQGQAENPDNEPQSTYLPLSSPAQVKEEIAQTLLKKSSVLRQFKKERIVASEPEASTDQFSPSETHLIAIMGRSYSKRKTMEQNVEYFIRNTGLTRDENEAAAFAKQAVAIFEEEKRNPNRVYFYHAVPSEISFAYKVYSELYGVLNAQPDNVSFRVDNPLFSKFMNINEFLAHFESLRGGVVNNYEKGFIESAISSNMFLFGNHNLSTSYTAGYYVNNSSRAAIDLQQMLKNVFNSTGVSKQEIKRLVKLYERYPARNQGALYQISFDKEDVGDYAYLAGNVGVKNPLTVNKRATLNPRDLVDAMRDKGVSYNYRDKGVSYNYIEQVQARLLVPPGAPLKASEFHLRPTSADDRFEQQLEKAVSDISHDVLTKSSSFDPRNRLTALLRPLDSILKMVGLSKENTKVTDDLLIQLIEAGDIEAIKSITADHPEYLKFDRILVPRRGYSSSHVSERPLSLIFRLLQKDRALPHITDIFGEEYYKGSLNILPAHRVVLTLPEKVARILRLNNNREVLDTRSVLNVIRQLPKEERLKFAQEHKEKIINGKGLAYIIESLNEEDRYAFARENEKIIEDGSQLATVLMHLPDNCKGDFALNNEKIISNKNQLLKVLEAIPEEDRTRVAIARQGVLDKVTPAQQKGLFKGEGISDIINCLPVKDRYDFAVNNINLVANAFDFWCVIDGLQARDRLRFVQNKLDIITNYLQLQDTLNRLPRNRDRLTLIIKRSDLIRGCENLCEFAPLLGTKYRLEFFLHNKGKIKGADGIAALLIHLSDSDKINLAIEMQDKIENGTGLARVLGQLDIDERVAFALTNEDKIEAASSLVKVLGELPENDRAEFATAHSNLFEEEPDYLSTIIKLLPKSEKLEFANRYKGLIIDGRALSYVINELEESDRLAFANDNSDKLDNGEALARVLDKLPMTDRYDFATNNRDKIGNEIHHVLRALPEQDRVRYANSNIADADGLVSALSHIDDEHRLDYALKNEHLIRDIRDLNEVIDVLRKGRLELAVKFEHLVTNIKELKGMVYRIGYEGSYKFAQLHKNKISNADELTKILWSMNSDYRERFALECSDLIKDIKDLSHVLSHTSGNGEEIVKLIDNHKDKITNCADLLTIIPTLSPSLVEKLVFEKSELINNVSDLVEILQTNLRIPAKNKLVLEKSELIQNAGDLVKVIRSSRFYHLGLVEVTKSKIKTISDLKEVLLNIEYEGDRMNFAMQEQNMALVKTSYDRDAIATTLSRYDKDSYIKECKSRKKRLGP